MSAAPANPEAVALDAAVRALDATLRRIDGAQSAAQRDAQRDAQSAAAWRRRPLLERLRVKWLAKSACCKGVHVACAPLTLALYLATLFCCCHCCGTNTCDDMVCGGAVGDPVRHG
jgi:hypothetical protein